MSETGRTEQRIKLWAEQAERRGGGIGADLVDASTKSCPGRCAPTRSADEVHLAIPNEVATGCDVCHQRYIRNKSKTTRRNPGSPLPAWAREKPTAAAPAVRPGIFTVYCAIGYVEIKTGPADRDNVWIIRWGLYLQGSGSVRIA